MTEAPEKSDNRGVKHWWTPLLPGLWLILVASSGWAKTVYHDQAEALRKVTSDAFELYVERRSGDAVEPHIIYFPFIDACEANADDTDVQSLVSVEAPQDNAPCRKGNALEGQVLISVNSQVSGVAQGAFETANVGRFQVVEIQQEVTGGWVNEVDIEGMRSKTIRVDVGGGCENLACALPAQGTSGQINRRLLIFWRAQSPISTSPSSASDQDSTSKQDRTLLPGDILELGDPEFSRGEVYDLRIARKLPSSEAHQLPHFQINRGDTQAYVHYNTEGLSLETSDIRGVRVVSYPQAQDKARYCDTSNNAGCQQLCRPESCPVEWWERVERKEGEVIWYGLKNGETANLSVCVENKWGFCSQFPPSDDVTPQSLETFLAGQSCFFFAAGFKREHYVIERLKQFRDQVLTRLPLGDKLIALYYALAAPRAPQVAASSFWSGFARTTGYLLYFILEYYYWLATGLLVGLFFPRHNWPLPAHKIGRSRGG